MTEVRAGPAARPAARPSPACRWLVERAAPLSPPRRSCAAAGGPRCGTPAPSVRDALGSAAQHGRRERKGGGGGAATILKRRMPHEGRTVGGRDGPARLARLPGPCTGRRALARRDVAWRAALASASKAGPVATFCGRGWGCCTLPQTEEVYVECRTKSSRNRKFCVRECQRIAAPASDVSDLKGSGLGSRRLPSCSAI
eukprot:scaffold1239_cov319-Prasinococcus_capsulatus_cf.AAC.2